MFTLMIIATTLPFASIEERNSSNNQPENLKIDILVRRPKEHCEPQNSDEIIVCAEKVDNESYRLRPIPNADKYETDEIKAKFAIGENTIAAAETEQAELGGGAQSKRLMVRLKIGF